MSLDLSTKVNKPAGIVHSFPEKIPEVQEFVVQLLDPVELLAAELGEAVGPGGPNLDHPHVADPRQHFLNLTKRLPKIRTCNEMSFLYNLKQVGLNHQYQNTTIDILTYLFCTLEFVSTEGISPTFK